MAESLFIVRHLTKSYGTKVVISGLSFDIEPGECFVILGRSGSGKSVTLRQLNGLEKPDSGSVIFDGLEVSALAERELYPVRRRIAMLFQGGALFDSMNVFDNVAFPMREHTSWARDEVAEQVHKKLAMVGLTNVDKVMPSDLSGGMKKRVALARSLALDPEVVLFDEPTSGLDPVTAATIGHLIDSTHRELAVTSVVVTHDLDLARRVASRIAFLSNGAFRFVGTWEEAQESEDPLFDDFLAAREEALDVA